MIGVVQQHDVSCRERGRRSSRDGRRRLPRTPVASPSGPEQRLPTPAAHELKRREAEDSVWWAEAERRRRSRVFDRRECPIEVLINGARAAEQQEAVAVSVHTDLVTGGDDLRRKRGKTLDLLADEEKGRGEAEPFELGKQSRRPLRVRPVVEGDRDPSAAGKTGANA